MDPWFVRVPAFSRIIKRHDNCFDLMIGLINFNMFEYSFDVFAFRTFSSSIFVLISGTAKFSGTQFLLNIKSETNDPNVMFRLKNRFRPKTTVFCNYGIRPNWSI